MIEILGLVVSAGLAYFFLKPYLQHPKARKKIIKKFVILLPLAVVGSLIGSYFIETGQPDSFKNGVALVIENNKVREKIGSYKALRFNEHELPEESDNPAYLIFEIEGSKGKIQLKSKVAKDKAGTWYLVELQDSLIEQY